MTASYQLPPVISALIAQGAIAFAGHLVSRAFRLHWGELLSGMPLGYTTELALSSMQWIPLVVAVILLVIMVAPFLRKHALWCTAWILILELLALAVCFLSFLEPVYTITYRMNQ